MQEFYRKRSKVTEISGIILSWLPGGQYITVATQIASIIDKGMVKFYNNKRYKNKKIKLEMKIYTKIGVKVKRTRFSIKLMPYARITKIKYRWVVL